MTGTMLEDSDKGSERTKEMIRGQLGLLVNHPWDPNCFAPTGHADSMVGTALRVMNFGRGEFRTV